MLIYIDSKPTDALVLYRLYDPKRHKLIYYTKEDILNMLTNKQDIKGIIAGVTDYGNIVDFIPKYKLEDTKLNKQIEKTKREIARYIVNLSDITVKSYPSYNYSSLENLDINKTILEKLKYCDYVLGLDWAKQYLTQLVLLLQNKYYNTEKIYGMW